MLGTFWKECEVVSAASRVLSEKPGPVYTIVAGGISRGGGGHRALVTSLAYSRALAYFGDRAATYKVN